MPPNRIHSFLVHPAKHADEQPDISGAAIPGRGSLFAMLAGVFERASEECDIDIVFRPDDNGRQQNACRDLLVTYARDPTVPNGRAVARRLQTVTTHRSGLGLLFLMKGQAGRHHQLVISRFPADQGVIAQENAQQQLLVEFLERVFMKTAKAYKSVLYSSDSLDRGFWTGSAVDRQISSPRELSDYWIREFLDSELRTTGPAGTKRLAVALREAIRSAPMEVRQELVAAANLFRGQQGRRQSTARLVEHLGLSAPAAAALTAAFPRPDLMGEVFQFDAEEFSRHVLYRWVQLDNGGMLTAEDARFPDIFRAEPVDQQGEHRIRYTTEGRVVDERLRKSP